MPSRDERAAEKDRHIVTGPIVSVGVGRREIFQSAGVGETDSEEALCAEVVAQRGVAIESLKTW